MGILKILKRMTMALPGRGLRRLGLLAAASAVPQVFAVTAGTLGYADFYWKWTPSATKTILDDLGSTPNITACWDFGNTVSLTDESGNTMEWGGMDDLKAKAKDALAKTWTRYGKVDVDFIYSASTDPCDVSIHFSNAERPNVPALGKQAHDIFLNWTWMTFNRTRSGKFVSAFSPVWEKYTNRLVPADLSKEEQIAWMIKNFLHEMGHIMGIDHEQDRRSIPMGIVSPEGVRQSLESGYIGNVAVGPYDPLTLMNYNSPPVPKTDLTCGDVMTIRLLYGKRPVPGDPRDFCDIICSGSGPLRKYSADDPTIVLPNSVQGQCLEPLVNSSDLTAPGYQSSEQQIVFPASTVTENKPVDVPDPTPVPSEIPPPIGNSCQNIDWISPPANPPSAWQMMQGDVLRVSLKVYVNPITRDWPEQRVIIQGVPTGTTYDVPAQTVYSTAGRGLTPGLQTITFDLVIPDAVCGTSAINHLPKCGPSGDYWLGLAWVQMQNFDGGAAAISRCDTRKGVWISKKKTKKVIQPVTTTTAAKTETLTLTSMMNFKNTADEEPAAARRGDILPIRWYQKGTWDKVNVYATLYREKGDALASSNPYFRTKLSILTGKDGVNTATLGLPTGSIIGSVPGGGNTDIMLHGWARIDLESNPVGKTAVTKVSSPAFKIEVFSKDDLQQYAGAEAERMIKVGAGAQNPYAFNRAFYIGQTEITNIDYWSTMGKFPDPYVKGPMNAAHGMTYYDAVLYCNVRSRQKGLQEVYSFTGQSYDSYGHCVGLTGLTVNPIMNGYRIPSGNEWIYAYYAGANPQNDQLYFWGNGGDYAVAEKYAWYDGNSAGLGLNRETPAAFKQPNAWGLHDMAGGVFEWNWEPSVTSGVSIRGGSASSSLTPPQLGFNSWPYSVTPSTYRSDTGFRICRTAYIPFPFLLME